MLREKIAAALQTAIIDSGMTVEEAGALVERTGTTISRWTSGQREPAINELELLCERLGYRLLVEIVPEEEAVRLDRLREVWDALPEEDRAAFLTRMETDALTTRLRSVLEALPKGERAGFVAGLEAATGHHRRASSRS